MKSRRRALRRQQHAILQLTHSRCLATAAAIAFSYRRFDITLEAPRTPMPRHSLARFSAPRHHSFSSSRCLYSRANSIAECFGRRAARATDKRRACFMTFSALPLYFELQSALMRMLIIYLHVRAMITMIARRSRRC